MTSPNHPGLRLLRFVVLLYAAVCVYAWLVADSMIFLPPPWRDPGTGTIVTIPSGDGAIAIDYRKQPGSRYTILFSHGNAEDLATIEFTAGPYRSLGYSTLCYDYRGYGLSSGKATCRHAMEDAESVYRYAVDELGIPEDQLIVHGRSVGAAFAIHQAARFRPAGLIVESGFLSAFRVMTHIPLIPFDRLNNHRAIREVQGPTLFIHGTHDNIVPFKHGSSLYDLSPSPGKKHAWIDHGDHNGLIFEHGDAYWFAIRTFIEDL